MLYYLLVTVYVLVCLLLIVVILLQQGKGGDIASAFGGGSSQAVFGARAGATLLTKMTTGLAAAFILLSLTLAVWGQRGPASVVGGVEPPPEPPAAAPTVPGSPVPVPGTSGNSSPQ
jgi:preprotein translocase subunit SecG